MMNTVRHSFHSIGDRSGDLARSVGSGTVDLARRIGDGTVTVARQIGPRRALIGLAVAVVAIGGTVMIMRYLRARRADSGRNIEGDEVKAPTKSAPTVAGGEPSNARISY
jgi:hypothetical protein